MKNNLTQGREAAEKPQDISFHSVLAPRAELIEVSLRNVPLENYMSQLMSSLRNKMSQFKSWKRDTSVSIIAATIKRQLYE